MITQNNSLSLIEKNDTLSISQMKILDILGHEPETTDVEIAKRVGYRYYNYISTVKNTILKPKGYLSGPYYWIDFSQICYNKLNRVIIFIMFSKEYSYEYITELLMRIECWSFIYPLEEAAFNQIIFSAYSTNNDNIIKIFEYLKNENIIFYYNAYEMQNQLENINPFFIKTKKNINNETNLINDNEFVLNKEFIHNNIYSKEKNIKISLLDSRIIMYLQCGEENCELSKLMKNDAKIRDNNGNTPYLFGYNSWRYSFEKLKNSGVIKKYYTTYPLPKNKCSHFFLLIKGNTDTDTKILANGIGSNVRINRSGTYVKSLNKKDNGELLWCTHIRCHPLYKEKLMDLLELPSIKYKIRYNVKSISNSILPKIKIVNLFKEQSISLEEKYYNINNQILTYDYDKYINNITKIINS